MFLVCSRNEGIFGSDREVYYFFDGATMVSVSHQYSPILLGKADFSGNPAESFFAQLHLEVDEFFCTRVRCIGYIGHAY